MKDTSFAKLFTLVLSLVLIATALLGVAAAAETEEQKTPDIVSQNVYYGGDFSLMFAVSKDSVSGDTLTLNVYDKEPAADSVPVWSKTIAASTATKPVNGVDCYVFTTAGVAAKDMDKNYYIQAVSDGKSGEVLKYSVAEYLYQRLYKDGTAFGTTDLEIAQAELYQSVLKMGENAQRVLFNFDDDTTNDRDYFVTDLCYVTINPKNGVDGQLNGGASAVLVKKGEKVSVGSASIFFNNKNWAAGEFELQSIIGSEITSTTTLTGNEVVADSHLIINPTRFFSLPTEPAPETFESMTTISTSVYSQSAMSSQELVEVDGDKKLKYTFVAGGEDSHTAKFNLPSASEDAEKLIWEADVHFDNVTTTSNSIRIKIGATTFSINLPATGMTCYDIPADNWYATISTNTEHKAHIRLEYFETTNSTGAKVFDTNFYVDGKLMNASGAKKYTAYSASYSVDKVTSVSVYSDPSVSGEYYFDNVKLFKTFAPEELVLGEHETFDGMTAVDTSKFTPSHSNSVSMATGTEGNALKLDFSSSNNEKINFKPLVEEEGADKIVFELMIDDNYAINQKASVGIDFYAGSTLVYDFRLNEGRLLTAESNGISWGISVVPGEINILKFELYMDGTNLVIDAYINGVKATRPSNFGAKVPVTGLSENLVDEITHITLCDEASSMQGYYLIDNVRFSKLNTAE